MRAATKNPSSSLSVSLPPPTPHLAVVAFAHKNKCAPRAALFRALPALIGVGWIDVIRAPVRLAAAEVPHPIKISVAHVDEVLFKLLVGLEPRHGSSSLLFITSDCLGILIIVSLGNIIVRGPPIAQQERKKERKKEKNKSMKSRATS